MVTFDNKQFNDWEEYFEHKFSDHSKYIIEELDESNKSLFSFKIYSTDSTNKMELIVRLFRDDTKEIFNAYFIHPASMVWNEEMKKMDGQYGWDGQGSLFNEKNLIDANKWIDETLRSGWIEKSYYFDDKIVSTYIIWDRIKEIEIPIKQNYLKNYGCMLIPVIPIIIYVKKWWWRIHPERYKSDEKNIPPMLD